MSPESLFRATRKHAAAIFFGEFVDFLQKGSGAYIRNQGTMTFVRYEGRCLGITNEHVYKAGTSNTSVWNIALTKHQPIPGRLLFSSNKEYSDFPFDIAVFELDEAIIQAGGKTAVDIDSRSGLKEGDQALAMGFPGRERYYVDESQEVVGHPLYHVLANCQCVSDRTIVLYEELSGRNEPTWHLGGMSGGPIFRSSSEDEYLCCGIVVDVLDPPLSGRIWINGFPLNVGQLDTAFNVFHVQ